MPASSNRLRTALKCSIGVERRHFRSSSRAPGNRGSRSGENSSISPIPHSVSALITTSTASDAPGLRCISRKLQVIVPNRTPPTVESIFPPSAATNGKPAMEVFTKSRLEMLIACHSVSEQQLERELKLAHGIARRQPCDLTKCGSTEVIERRSIKDGMIRQIECLCPELQVVALAERERFEQREIDHILIRTIRQVAGSVP